jgi:D-aminopeptidase
MKPFPLHQIVHVKRRGNHGHAALRTVIVAALCLGIGFGLGGLWHSRRVQQAGVSTEAANETAVNTTAQALATPGTVLPVASAPPDPAIVAEVKRQVPNFATIPLEQGSQILRAAALRDLQAALSQMQPELKDAEQRVARLEEANSETGKQAALKELQRLQAAQAAKLDEVTTRSSSQIEVLRQLKESAR